MKRSLYREIVWGVHDAFRTVIPEPQNRTPVTLGIVPYVLASCIPFIFMAYLARRPGTHLMRVLLLPTVIITAIGTACRYVWTNPQLNVYNWSQCLIAEVVIGKALEFAFIKEGRLKVGEVLPGVMEVSKVTKDVADASSVQSGVWFLPQWLYDSLEVTLALRGLGWDWGEGVHVPKQTRPLDRSGFLRATIISLLKNYLLLDFTDTILKMFPGVGTPRGASMFYPDLLALQRYTISTAIHMLTGSAMLAGFGMTYDCVTLIGVIALQSSPASWPPVIDHPWGADSLHVFWSMHWHQLLRQTFMAFGGYPGKWLAGNTGMVLGAFVASGLFHECAIYSMNRGFDYRGIAFFAIQGPFLIGERLWRKVTGRRVAGWGGRLWVYFCLLILAQPLTDSWFMRGLGGAIVIPPRLSPARVIVLPLAQRIRHHLLQQLHSVQP